MQCPKKRSSFQSMDHNMYQFFELKVPVYIYIYSTSSNTTHTVAAHSTAPWGHFYTHIEPFLDDHRLVDGSHQPHIFSLFNLVNWHTHIHTGTYHSDQRTQQQIQYIFRKLFLVKHLLEMLIFLVHRYQTHFRTFLEN